MKVHKKEKEKRRIGHMKVQEKEKREREYIYI
jgi:hypothetical protein